MTNEKNKNIAVFVDMDGVVANFDQAVKNKYGIDTKELNKSAKYLTQDQKKLKGIMYARISKAGADFWETIKPYDRSKEMWDVINNNFHNVTVLTAHLSHSSGIESCKVGKKNWVENHFGITAGNHNFVCCKSVEKQNYVGYHGTEKAILIDDRAKNIEEWIAAGGIGILHTSIEETLAELAKYM